MYAKQLKCVSLLTGYLINNKLELYLKETVLIEIQIGYCDNNQN